MTSKKLFVLVMALAFAGPLFGQGPNRLDPIKQLLFPPELIMKHRAKLNLDDKQQKILKQELQRAQADVFDLKWRIDDETDILAKILETTPINESELLAQADKVMALEQQIKRSHLTLLARLKNILSNEQIKMLSGFRKSRSQKGQRPR